MTAATVSNNKVVSLTYVVRNQKATLEEIRNGWPLGDMPPLQ